MNFELPELNLVPTSAGKAPNYWCTWNVQNVAWMEGRDHVEPREIEGAAGAMKARACLDEDHLLRENGWAKCFFQRSREDMFLVLDDGWDTPLSGTMVEHLSSMLIHPSRFPSFQEGTPAQRLKSLNDAIKSAGWRGIGVWLPANESGPYMDDHPNMEPEDYWRERLEWCREAGIEYWKIDWGMFANNHDFRRMLSRLAREIHPSLVVEHSVGTGMLNNPCGRVDPRWLKEVTEQISYSSIVRLYDISPQLAIPSMLERVWASLNAARPEPGHECFINVEDEVYIGAALGCTFGVMRHPQVGEPRFPLPIGARDNNQRLVEVDRALGWQRIAPPFPVGIGIVHASDTIFVDSYTFAEGETWDRSVIGKTVEQAAPSIISRNMSLPRVKKSRDGDGAYIAASRNPNGAVAIAALGRITAGHQFRSPQCVVEILLDDIIAPIGIFGRFKEVTLTCDKPSRDLRTCNVYVQDLADTDAMDATAMVLVEKNSICITGGLINEAGSIAGTPGDESEPALVVFLE